MAVGTPPFPLCVSEKRTNVAKRLKLPHSFDGMCSLWLLFLKFIVMPPGKLEACFKKKGY